ncbi:Methyl-accepting chemotaxis protein (MCP) signaling domain protein [compost metagenome]
MTLARVNAQTDRVIHDNVPKSMTSSAMMDDLNNIAIALRNLLVMDGAAEHSAQFESIRGARQGIDEKVAFLERTIASETGKGILAKLIALRAKYKSETDEVLALIARGERDAARDMLVGRVRFTLVAYKGALLEMTKFQERRMDEIGVSARDAYETSRMLMIGLGALATLFAALIGTWITRSITRPLNEALQVATTVARGDLSSRIAATSRDETGQLLAALAHMNGSLATIVTEVRNSTEAINSASGQIAAGNLDLSARTEQQASSLEETAASVEELTSTVRQNADNARQASQLALTASDVATRGGGVVAEVVNTMDSIAESSRKIVEITSVIEGIAFQTNILALNAAVEAARAGEQGRGFAVVAGEVRSLAQRSATAAKEIKTLIDDSVAKVDDGTKLVDAAGATMQEIVISVQRVSDIMGEISSATQEQTQGIEQVNEAIAQIDQVTQQNAALVEQASAAAASMQDQAGNLVRAVATFKVAGDAAGRQSSRAAQTVRTVAQTGKPHIGAIAGAISGAIPGAIPGAAQGSAVPGGAPAPKAPAVENWEQF